MFLVTKQTKETTKTMSCKNTKQKVTISLKKQAILKKPPKWSPQKWVYFGRSHFGASGSTSGAPVRFLHTKCTQMLQKWYQDCKYASKRDPKIVKVSPKQCIILENDTASDPRPADCAKRLE
jgi:hypothetical protein